MQAQTLFLFRIASQGAYFQINRLRCGSFRNSVLQVAGYVCCLHVMKHDTPEHGENVFEVVVFDADSGRRNIT